ncbi:dihydrofolate reductase [Clostridium botulinum]|uniref:Dihydrofolate reductase n=1 Tax=Clostridium botulinum TaxID=1491 RepID=A0A6G4CP90_CLOBO|nr:dihydrofolate reductase [Clostridium botulinum]NEZ99504.1 dihydrofolate reductase [Clostridium botulinum]NFA30971.1 dihydrofolate reductase [Clostridium botulinum]NFA84441.1 dihydrofolate reductase [Clostridium botulinum]NFB05201.1 dihydrofolate reductase [Clostridium botulinum]
MSGKIIMNLAISIDGYIADESGGFDWIVGQGHTAIDTAERSEFEEFLAGIDIVVMSKNCYDQGFPKEYPTKMVYVATSEEKEDEGNIRFICGDIVSIFEKEKNSGKNIFLFGGGGLIDHFVKANVIHEYIVGIIPTILGKGRPLFLGNNPTIQLHLDKYTVSDGITVFYYSKR